MSSSRETFKIYLYSFIIAIAGIWLSAAFKWVLGAPNYSLGIVVAATYAGYRFGLGPAVFCYFVTSSGVLYWLVPPVGTVAVESTEDWIRLVAVLLTLFVTLTLVLLLRTAERRLWERNEQLHATTGELRDTQARLAEALEHESRIARSLQLAFLPTIPERLNGFRLDAIYEPGSSEAEIGGDFYDVFQMPDGRISIAIGDASGKGINAARQAVAAKYGMRFCTMECEDPGHCLQILNDLLNRDAEFSGFVTLFYGILDPVTRRLTYCSGGHEPPLVYRESTDEVLSLNATGLFVGMVEDGAFEMDMIDLVKGDRVLLFTDGITEARGEQGMLGTEGLQRLIRETAQVDVKTGLHRVVEAARQYAQGRFTDDVAAVMLLVG